MATAVILDDLNNKTKNIKTKGYPLVNIVEENPLAIIIDDVNPNTELIELTKYPIVQIEDTPRQVSIEEILPFRVKFTSIQIQNISGMVPPIPLQVIGYSNYIL